MHSDHKPAAHYFGPNAPTDEQLHNAMMEAIKDDRVSEALKVFVATYRGVPLATILATVFYSWDKLDRQSKISQMVEMSGWLMEWLDPMSLTESIAAWESPWDGVGKGGDANG